jgi:hypothetical protein
MERDEFTYWEFTDADYDMAFDWNKQHGGRLAMRREWLPAAGFIICQHNEPVIIFFLYFDPSSTAAFIDWVITRPKLPLEVSKAGLDYALREPIRNAMIEHGANTVVSRSPRAMARVMNHVSSRWVLGDEVVTLSYQFRPEELK